MLKRFWTKEEIRVVENLYPNSHPQCIANVIGRTLSQVYNRAYLSKLKRENVGSFRKGKRNNPSTEFKKGFTPWNKGMKGIQMGREETQFKAGDDPPNTRPIHSTRKDKDGFIYIKTSKSKRWDLLHRHNWEKVNGKIEKGMVVSFKDKDRSNCDVPNLELLTRSENMKRNSIHNLPDSLKEAIIAIRSLTRKINKDE